MVLVRSEAGQLLMIPQQVLAQMQATRATTPASTTPGQVTSTQVIHITSHTLTFYHSHMSGVTHKPIAVQYHSFLFIIVSTNSFTLASDDNSGLVVYPGSLMITFSDFI